MRPILAIALISLAGCSSLDSINRQVNDYPYIADTPAESEGPPKLMSAASGGDCEDSPTPRRY